MFNRFTLDFAWSYNLKNFRATGHRYLGWNKGCLSPWRTVLSAINPANQPLEKTKEFLCKPAEEQNQRLTTGTRSPLHSWMQTSRPTPICLCKPFSSQGCPGTMYAAKHVQDVLDLSNAKLGCTTGGSGEVVQRAALAAPSWTGRRQNRSPSKQASLVLSKASKERQIASLFILAFVKTTLHLLNREKTRMISPEAV